MAAAATKLIQVRSNHCRLNTIRLFSSSTTPTPPTPDADDKPPSEPNSSRSQKSSYFIGQSQSQQQMNPSFRAFPARNSVEEIGKKLSEFRRHTTFRSTPAGPQSTASLLNDEKLETPRLSATVNKTNGSATAYKDLKIVLSKMNKAKNERLDRLAKYRQMEMEERDKTNVSTTSFKDLKNVMSKMNLAEHDKAKKQSRIPAISSETIRKTEE